MFECDEADEVTWEVRLTEVNDRDHGSIVGLERGRHRFCLSGYLRRLQRRCHSPVPFALAAFTVSASSTVEVNPLGPHRRKRRQFPFLSPRSI